MGASKAASEAGPSSSSLTYRAANALTWGLSKALHLLDGGRFAATSPYLSNNFAPVSEEVWASELEVLEGALPAALAGAFVRVGPNPKYLPGGRYHW